jgi:hypothetical protein
LPITASEQIIQQRSFAGVTDFRLVSLFSPRYSARGDGDVGV